MMIKSIKFIRVARCAAIATALFLGFTCTSFASDQPLKIGFLTSSAIGKYGWNYSHNLGRLALEAHFGDRIETALFAEDNANEAIAEIVLQSMLEDGYRMIFLWSYGYEDLVHRYAKQYPDVVFEICTGRNPAQNIATYSARFYEGRYAAGVLAAKMSKSGKIGYIGSVNIPEIVRGINSVAIGARKVNPQANVLAFLTHTWSDPEREAFATKFLLAEGADVLITHTNAEQTLLITERNGFFAFGKASDMSYLAPNAHLAAISNDWSQYYINRVQAVLDGSWESIRNWGGKDGPMVRLTHYNQKHISPEIVEFVQDMEKEVLAGQVHPFAGPIRNIQGDLVVPESEVLSDDQLREMNWLVEGVVVY